MRGWMGERVIGEQEVREPAFLPRLYLSLHLTITSSFDTI
jgi:hypothetical protein